MTYTLIAITVCLTVAGQLLVKAGMLEVGALPDHLSAVPTFVVHTLANFKVIGGLGAAILAALAWMGAVSLSDISFAYPFMGLAIVIVLALSPSVFGEGVPVNRWLGVVIVCAGLWVAAQEWPM